MNSTQNVEEPKLIYSIANRAILPVFPFIVIGAMRLYGGNDGDIFFVLYSLSVLVSSISDFGFRFFPYQVNPDEYFLFDKIKIIFSLVALFLYCYISIFIYKFNISECLIIGFAIPFYGLVDINTHGMRAIGRQKDLFWVSIFSWLIAFFLSFIFFRHGYFVYFSLVVFISNLLRSIGCHFILISYKPKKGNFQAIHKIDFFQGIAVFMNILKEKLPFLLYALVYSQKDLAILGIFFSIVNKFVMFGAALFEVKFKQSYILSSKEITCVLFFSALIGFIFLLIISFVSPSSFPMFWSLIVAMVAALGFFNEYFRMLFFVTKNAKFLFLLNFILNFLIILLIHIIDKKNALIFTIAFVEIFSFIFYFSTMKKIKISTF